MKRLIVRLDATRILSDASEQDIAAYQKNLRKVKTRASTDLQHNVYQNRTQFIKISKEAEKLKGEMRMLRGLMSELTNSLATASMSSALAPGLREPSLEDGSARARKKANRSSVANLEAMWTTHLHSMWKNIEGSQKYLPAIPGRHIVHETGNWVELDAATWKPRRPVHIVLLNDHLLVATRKRKKIDPNLANANQKAPTKLVAERCWTLQEIDMLDLAASATLPNGARGMKEISNAVSIRRNNESFTYRSDKPDSTAKTNLFLAFRRTMDELRRMERSEGEEASNKNKETLDYLSARDPAISDNSSLLRSLSKSKDRPEVMIDVDGKQRNLRWVEGQVDELDIEIALQRFDEAVKHVERLRRLARGLKNNEMAQDLITAKVDERARKLAGMKNFLLLLVSSMLHAYRAIDLVTQRLVDTHSALHATQTNISWLVRLNYEDRARESYLRARTAILTKRSRQCIFEGDLQQYITEISFVYFTLLKNTVSIYQQCFPPLMMSACVKWAKEHLDALNGVLKRQLGSVARGSEVVKECLERAREHAAMMGEVGLGFRDLVGVELLEEVGS